MTETRYDVPGGGIAPPIALCLIGWLLSGMTAALVYVARRGRHRVV